MYLSTTAIYTFSGVNVGLAIFFDIVDFDIVDFDIVDFDIIDLGVVDLGIVDVTTWKPYC